MIYDRNNISLDDTIINTWFERDRAHVALWMKDEDGGQGRELLVEWWDEAVGEAVEDGFLNPRDWHGSAYEYAKERGMLETVGQPASPR